MFILFVYTLLKVVSYYDLSVLSMSVMGFKKKFGWGLVGGVSCIQVYLGFLEFVILCKAPKCEGISSNTGLDTQKRSLIQEDVNNNNSKHFKHQDWSMVIENMLCCFRC